MEGKSRCLGGFFQFATSTNDTNATLLAPVDLASPKLLDMCSPYVIPQTFIWAISEVENHILVN